MDARESQTNHPTEESEPRHGDISSRFNAALFNANRAGGMAVTVDCEKYRHFLDDSGLDDAGKVECMQAYWNVICEFVAMGFGIHPVQDEPENGGKLGTDACASAPEPPDRVDSIRQFIRANHSDLASPDAERPGEGVSV